MCSRGGAGVVPIWLTEAAILQACAAAAAQPNSKCLTSALLPFIAQLASGQGIWYNEYHENCH